MPVRRSVLRSAPPALLQYAAFSLQHFPTIAETAQQSQFTRQTGIAESGRVVWLLSKLQTTLGHIEKVTVFVYRRNKYKKSWEFQAQTSFRLVQ